MYSQHTRKHSHWIDGPQDKGETSNRSVEGLGLAVLVGNGCAAIESQLVDDHQVGNASPSIPSPGLAALAAERSKQSCQDHDDIGNNCNQDVGTTQTGKKTQVEQEKWGGDSPVNVACIIDLSPVVLVCVWNLLVVDGLSVGIVAHAVTSSHGKVGDECKGGNEGSEDVEETFLLGIVSTWFLGQ